MTASVTNVHRDREEPFICLVANFGPTTTEPFHGDKSPKAAVRPTIIMESHHSHAQMLGIILEALKDGKVLETAHRPK